MSDLIVRRLADDGLSRQQWTFRVGAGPHGTGYAVVLTSYGVQRRAALGRIFRRPELAERWGCGDERPYASGLPRPTSIPADVLAEALASAPPPRVFIGFLNAQSEYLP